MALSLFQSLWLITRLRGRGRWGDEGGTQGPGGSEGAWDPEEGMLTPCWRKGT